MSMVPTSIKGKISHKIKVAIACKGWNSKQLAFVMGVSPSTVTRWLSGNHNFTVDTLCLIQKALDITLINTEISVS
jgi:transcriptional regulator with XRE-family HTH domain